MSLEGIIMPKRWFVLVHLPSGILLVRKDGKHFRHFDDGCYRTATGIGAC